MSDEVKRNDFISTMSQFGASGSLILLVVIFLGFSIWSNTQQTESNNKQVEILEEIKEGNRNTKDLIEESRKIVEFQECVSDVTDNINISVSQLKKELGATLEKYQVPFPQPVNNAFDVLQNNLNNLHKCLINPKDVK